MVGLRPEFRLADLHRSGLRAVRAGDAPDHQLVGVAGLAGGLFVVLFLLASSTVLVPVLLLAIKGKSVIPLLDRSHAWVSEHSRHITIIVAAVFGAVLLIAGLHEFLQVR